MIDPITAIAGASAAFNAIKKGIQVGKDLQDMGGQLSQWAGAMADIDFAKQQTENPPWYKALGGGVEAQAMEVFAAQKKKDAMRKELKDFICVAYGPSHWEELLSIEAEMRKSKRETEFRKMELKQSIIEWTAGFILFLIAASCLAGIIWLTTL
jgi:deferrochelatase/peroxidase EfeB